MFSVFLLFVFYQNILVAGGRLDDELRRFEEARSEQQKKKGLVVEDPLTEKHLMEVERFAHRFLRRLAKKQDWEALVKYDEKGKNNNVLPPENIKRYRIRERYLERKYLATYDRYECKFLYLVDVQGEKREKNRSVKYVKTYVLRITDYPELGIITFRRLATGILDLDGYSIIDFSKFEPLNVKPVTYEPIEEEM